VLLVRLVKLCLKEHALFAEKRKTSMAEKKMRMVILRARIVFTNTVPNARYVGNK